MNGFENVLLAYVLNSVWQAPLLFVAAWVAARLLRTAGPAAEHRVWVGALLLQSVLPAFRFFPGRGSILRAVAAHGAAPANAQVSVLMGAGNGFGALRLPPAMMTAAAVAYAAADRLLCCALYLAMCASLRHDSWNGAAGVEL